MPKERIRKYGNDGWADLLVQWGEEELGHEDGRKNVRLFVIQPDLGPSGSFMFHPDNPEEIGLDEGNAIGPVDIRLDREGIQRLIRVLRQARDRTFGRDE